MNRFGSLSQNQKYMFALSSFVLKKFAVDVFALSGLKWKQKSFYMSFEKMSLCFIQDNPQMLL